MKCLERLHGTCARTCSATAGPQRSTQHRYLPPCDRRRLLGLIWSTDAWTPSGGDTICASNFNVLPPIRYPCWSAYAEIHSQKPCIFVASLSFSDVLICNMCKRSFPTLQAFIPHTLSVHYPHFKRPFPTLQAFIPHTLSVHTPHFKRPFPTLQTF